MRGERWQFNNHQLAQERWWRNERGGDATTNKHERGAAQGERRWHATRKWRGGTARGCTGSTTKGDAARQQVI